MPTGLYSIPEKVCRKLVGAVSVRLSRLLKRLFVHVRHEKTYSIIADTALESIREITVLSVTSKTSI